MFKLKNKKIIANLFAGIIVLIPYSILPQTDAEHLVPVCEEAKDWIITDENSAKKAIDLVDKIKSHKDNPLEKGYYRYNIRSTYEKLNEKLGNYYLKGARFKTALNCFKEALKSSISKPAEYRQKIAECQDAIKNKKGEDTKVPPVKNWDLNPIVIFVSFLVVLAAAVVPPAVVAAVAFVIIFFLFRRFNVKKQNKPKKTQPNLKDDKKIPPKKEMSEVSEDSKTAKTNPPEEPKERIELDRLWGKLYYKDKYGKDEGIDLSDKEDKYIFEDKNFFTKVTFEINIQDGMKTIIVTPESTKAKVEFLDENDNPLKSKFIDNNTQYIQINKKSKRDKKTKSIRFEYFFLERIGKSYAEPVWERGDFIGRDDELEKIKENFLKEDGDYYDCVISGMGKSGKTSLMRHLNEIYFSDKEEILSEKFITQLFEYDQEKYEKFSNFKSEVEAWLKTIKDSNRRKIIILIDEWDKLIAKHKRYFIGFIWKCKRANHFFIFSGQKGKKLIENELPKNCDLPPHIKQITLYGLDVGKKPDDNNVNNSISLIDKMLKEICFPGNYFLNSTKEYIASITSSLPSLIKEILESAISEWLQNHEIRPITPDDVRKAVVASETADDQEDRLYRWVTDYDIRSNPHKKIINEELSVTEIIEALKSCSDSEGKVNLKDFRDKISKYPGSDNKKLIGKRMKSFDEKIDILASMGYVKRDGDNLFGVPRMVFDNEVRNQC